MSALASRSNPFLDGFKAEINKLIWQCYEDIKDDSVPLHLTVFHVPIGLNVKISNLQGIIEKLVGPEGAYDAPVAPPAPPAPATLDPAPVDPPAAGAPPSAPPSAPSA